MGGLEDNGRFHLCHEYSYWIHVRGMIEIISVIPHIFQMTTEIGACALIFASTDDILTIILCALWNEQSSQ